MTRERGMCLFVEMNILKYMYIIVMVCNTSVNVGLFREVCLQSCIAVA